jgi:hypothetical protein
MAGHSQSPLGSLASIFLMWGTWERDAEGAGLNETRKIAHHQAQ